MILQKPHHFNQHTLYTELYLRLHTTMGNCSDVHKMSCFSKTQPLFVNSAFLLIPWFLIQRKEDNLFSMVRKLMLDLMDWRRQVLSQALPVVWTTYCIVIPHVVWQLHTAIISSNFPWRGSNIYEGTNKNGFVEVNISPKCLQVNIQTDVFVVVFLGSGEATEIKDYIIDWLRKQVIHFTIQSQICDFNWFKFDVNISELFVHKGIII